MSNPTHNQPTPRDLPAALLSPADLQRVMGVGESTVATWLRDGEIRHFRCGRLIRIEPAAVWEFIRGRSRNVGRVGPGGQVGPVGLAERDWDCLSRLISFEVMKFARANRLRGETEGEMRARVRAEMAAEAEAAETLATEGKVAA